MRYLLDTCVLLWALAEDERRIKDFVPIILEPQNYIAVSVISYWEIAVKKALGKLKIPDNLNKIVEDTGFNWINLEIKHIQQLEKLPMLHTDPFDRLLIAQAMSDGMTLLTTDTAILQYFKAN